MRLLLILALTAAFGMLLSALLMLVAAPAEADEGITLDLLYYAH